jgi:2'-5' RNA ligase
MRAFIGIPLDGEMALAYERYLAARKSQLPQLRWVPPRNLHLTLYFIGEVTKLRVAEVQRALGAAACGVEPFDARLGDEGSFGSRAVPRVLWFGIDRGRDELVILASAIARAMESCGFPKGKRAWTPHLTVARNPKKKPVGDWRERTSGLLVGRSFRVENVTLFESELSPRGSRYTAHWSVPLGAP